MQILKVIFILLEVLLLFNLLIFVHELGHFLAARWRKLKIERFAIWFGKPIWQKEINGVVYCLGSIPAGGYVALPQMAAMEAIEGRNKSNSEELPPISALDKIIVAFAGPLFSFGLAILFAVIVWQIGRPVGEGEKNRVIGYVFKGSPAESAGLRPGDEIIAVDGQPVSRFGGIGDSIHWRIVRSEGDTIQIGFMRDGREQTVEVKPKKEETAAWERRALRQIQILPKETAIIARIEPNSPAAMAGLKPNDIVLAANGKVLFHPTMISDEIRSAPDKPLELRIKRGTNEINRSMTPVHPDGWKDNKEIPEELRFPQLGITWEAGGRLDIDNPAPFEQIRASVDAMVSTFGAIISRKSDIGFQHLSGPVGIVRIYYRLFESENGWRLAIWFSVVLNVNLALLNLLPVPVLDGGHITLAIVEALRRKPVNVRIINAVQTSCAALIIGYMLFITFFDAQDWRPWKRSPKMPERRFTVPSGPTQIQ
ncbi:MAG TPA: RIP metalloprotease RseP [Verrucomicrobiae bacterium]|nr:RIP metalloprotease RseP [Verrucomicrobiae bacterium]